MGFMWPPDYNVEIKRRLLGHIRARDDHMTRVALWAHYAENPVDFINDWCVTFDPRVKNMRVMPFILFPRQVEFIHLLHECVTQRESALIEKCRDVGASWLCGAFSIWMWLFHPGSTIGWGSRKAEYVDDKANPKAIFPKMRQILDNLPAWLIPMGFSMREHAPYMKIINPLNGSAITGESGDNIGRGGRSTIFFKDESAHYPRPELIEAALSANTEVQIDISSVNGSGNPFHRKRMAGVIWTPGCKIPHGKIRVFIFDWRDHPNKTQAWYDVEREKYESIGLLHILAQEIDRDYSSALEGIIVKPAWAEAAVDAHIKRADLGDWFAGECIAAQDVADGGYDRNAYSSKKGVVLKRIKEWGGEAGDAANISLDYAREDGVTEIHYDADGVGAGYKVEINRMQEQPSWPKNLSVYKWRGGQEVHNPEDHVIPGDSNSPTNEDLYLNLKAQSYMSLGQRFWKTYLAVTRGKDYPVSELISIPSDLENRHKLMMELSQPVKKTNGVGKTLVDKTPDGTPSPNNADSVNMLYSPNRPAKGFFDI